MQPAMHESILQTSKKKTSPAGFTDCGEVFFWYPIDCALCHLYPTLMRRPRPLSDLKISGRIKYNYHKNKELPLCQRKSSVESTVFRLFKLSH